MSTATLQIEKKKTVIPQLRFQEFDGEWKQKKLGEVSNFLDGRRKPIKSDDRSKMKGEYPYYGASGIIDYVNNYIFDEELILLGEDGENIISRNSPLAFRVSGKCWINNHAHVIVPKKDTDIDFLALNLERINYVVYNTGTAQPKLNQEVCRGIPSWFPTLPEQQKIASFLSAVDEKIQQLCRKKELLGQYKKGVMQQLFSGKLRFKDENGTDYADWEEKKLGDVVEKDRKIRYGIVQPGAYDPNGRFMIRGQDYSAVKGWADSSSFFKVSEEVEQKYRKARVKSGDLLITIVGAGTGWLEVVPDFLEGANITQTTGRIAVNKSVASPGYVKNYFFTYKGRKEINTYIKGQAQPGLNIGDVEIFILPLPCLEEQQKIANFLSSIDSKIESTNQQITQMQSFKKGLLQQLFV